MKEGEEARFRSVLNTPQAKLLIGKMRGKKPKDDSVGALTNHVGIFFHNGLKCK